MRPLSLTTLLYSFNARIIGTTLLLLTATTMALNTYFYHRASAELKEELIHHNQSMAKILANTSRLGVFTADREALTTAAAFVNRENDCQYVIFFDDTGAPLLKHGCCPQSPTLVATLTDQEIFREIVVHRYDPSFFFPLEQSLIMVEPVMADLKPSVEDLFFPTADTASKPSPKTIGYVVLAVDTAPHQAKVRAMFFRDTAITTAVTLLSCLIIFGIIQFLTRPLRELTREVIGDTPAEPASTPLGEPAAGPNDFKRMITIIRNSFQTVNDLKTTLEEKVAARTRQLAAKNEELISQKDGLATANQKLAITLSQLQSTQAQLVQSEKMAALGMLIAGLSHEIKNSINFIACSVPLLKKTLAAMPECPPCPGKKSPADQATELLANIQEGVHRTVRVIDDLAHFCHDNGSGFIPTDILPGLKASIAILRHEYKSRIRIVEEYSEPLPMVQGRAGQLNQVFINILLNAAQAIPAQGTIEVRAWATAAKVHVAITDSGEGIKERNMSRIYDPFFTTKEVGQGTGLGLSISYNIVKNHGGDLKVNSAAGAGTTFEIVLPVIAETEGMVREEGGVRGHESEEGGRLFP